MVIPLIEILSLSNMKVGNKFGRCVITRSFKNRNSQAKVIDQNCASGSNVYKMIERKGRK